MLQSWAKNEKSMPKSYTELQRESLLPKWDLVIFETSFFQTYSQNTSKNVTFYKNVRNIPVRKYN